MFQNFQNLEFDPLRCQVFGNDLARSFLWLKHQGMRLTLYVRPCDATLQREASLEANMLAGGPDCC